MDGQPLLFLLGGFNRDHKGIVSFFKGQAHPLLLLLLLLCRWVGLEFVAGVVTESFARETRD